MSQPQQPPVGVSVCYRHPDRPANIRCQRCDRPICPDCMVPAAVGFQCPSCVAEGRRTQRQARTPYGGAIASNRTPYVTYALIGINLAVWLAVIATGGNASHLVDVLGLRSQGGCLRGNFIYPDIAQSACTGRGQTFLDSVSGGAYWQLITSQFLHVAIWHIAGNMLTLYVLGTQLEPLLGRARYLALYLVAGLTGSAAVYLFSSSVGLTLGASGAIYGLFGAMVVIAIKVKADLRSILGVLAINVFITFAIPNISWQGHLGGFLGGLAVSGLLVYAPRGERRGVVQWSGIGAITVLVLVVLVVRTAALT